MDITEAFTLVDQDATRLDEDEEASVRALLQQLFTNNMIEFTRDHENIAALAFVAGRNYQSDLMPEYTVTMNPAMVEAFMEFLIRRTNDRSG